MLALVLIEIRAVPAERSRGRHNPRAVKRKISRFPTRCRAAPGDGCRWRYEEHIRVQPPARSKPAVPTAAGAEPAPGAASPTPKRKAECPAANPDHGRHVQAWRASGLSRTDYCRQHDLDQRAFNYWVARRRHAFPRKGHGATPGS